MIEDAIKAALQSENHYKMGAAVYDKKKNLLSIGWNKQKTHVKQAHWAFKAGQPLRQYLHAEIDALIKARSGVPHTIIVVRITSKGLSIAKPCEVCQRALIDMGIKRIYWTDRRGVLQCQED